MWKFRLKREDESIIWDNGAKENKERLSKYVEMFASAEGENEEHRVVINLPTLFIYLFNDNP